MLDDDGGYTVWGADAAAASVTLGGLPIGLADGVDVIRDAPRVHRALADVRLKGERPKPPPPPTRGHRRPPG